MMGKRVLAVVVLVGLLPFGAKAQADPIAIGSVGLRLNAVKLNLGLLHVMDAVWYKDLSQRFSVELTHSLKSYKRLAWTVDAEMYRFEEHPLVEISPGFFEYANSRQLHFGLHVGGRYFPILDSQNGKWGLFIEPQVAFRLDRAKYHVGTGAPDETKREFGIDMRAKAGGRVMIGNRWTMEGSAEIYRKHYIFSGTTVILMLPELNIGYRF